jgi:hypothetical protein
MQRHAVAQCFVPPKCHNCSQLFTIAHTSWHEVHTTLLFHKLPRVSSTSWDRERSLRDLKIFLPEIWKLWLYLFLLGFPRPTLTPTASPRVTTRLAISRRCGNGSRRRWTSLAPLTPSALSLHRPSCDLLPSCCAVTLASAHWKGLLVLACPCVGPAYACCF